MQSMTYGPKITKGGDPGRELKIDITACSCGGFSSIKGLTTLIGKVFCVSIGDVRRWSTWGNKTRPSLKAVSMAMCWRRTGMRFSLNRTRYVALGENVRPKFVWKQRPTSSRRMMCTYPSNHLSVSLFSCTRMRSPSYVVLSEHRDRR